jgi:predicted transcriptional regulator
MRNLFKRGSRKLKKSQEVRSEEEQQQYVEGRHIAHNQPIVEEQNSMTDCKFVTEKKLIL